MSHAVRVMLNACSPTWLTQPPTTWPTSAGSMPERSTSSPVHVGQQVGGVDGRQAAVPRRPIGDADGFDDHDVGHRRQPMGG